MLVQTTLLYAGLLGLLLVSLSFNILYQWVRTTRRGQDTDQALRRAERVLTSFTEQVPLTLVLLTLIELKGAPASILHTLGLLLITGRLMHASGSNRIAGAGLLRFMGTQFTYLAVLVASLACIYFYGFGRV